MKKKIEKKVTAGEIETLKKQMLKSISLDVISYVVEVTPELAKKWLLTSKGNRTLVASNIEKMKEDMKAGRWLITDQGIGFDSNGCLMNGHHRLTAVIESGITIQSLVVMGLSEKAKDVVDTGAKRTPGHILGMRGVANANTVAAMLRVYCAVENSTRIHSKNEVEKWLSVYESNPKSFAAIVPLAARPFFDSTVWGVIFAYAIDPMTVLDFANKITSKIGIEANSPESAFLHAMSRIPKNAGYVHAQTKINIIAAALYHKLHKTKTVKVLHPSEVHREYLVKTRTTNL